MPDFSDAKNQAKSQIQSSASSGDIRDAARDLRSSTQHLSNTNANQVQQQQQLVQAIQQQSQQIQTLAMQVQSKSMGQPPPAVPPPPIRPNFAPAFATAAQFAGTTSRAVGGHMMSRGGQLAGAVGNQYEQMRHTGYGVQGGGLGLLDSPQSGVMGGAFHASGMSWNPSAAQSYGYGAYQRSQAHNAGRAAQQWGMGAASTAMGMLSVGGAGSLIGGGIGAVMGGPMAPLTGAVGSMIGGAIGAPMDYFNPLSFGMQEAQRSMGFGRSANQSSNTFLRGRGGRGGAFDLAQQAQIGRGISDLSLKDLTFSNQDIQGFQGDFAESGQMLGVQDAKQYQDRFRKLMDNTKGIMKALQLTKDEAVEFMRTGFSDIGVNAGSQQAIMATQIGAASHMAGLSPMEGARRTAAAARGGGAYGLLAHTGGITGMQAMGHAGVASGGAVNTNLLASVGGQQGLEGILAGAQNKFLAGPGGAMGVFGGKGGVFQRMGKLGNVTSDDMINFSANGNEMIDEMMEKDPTYAQRQMIMDLDQLAGMMPGQNHRAKMVLMAKSQFGMSSTQAQALVDSAKAMPGAIAKDKMNKRSQHGDLVMDQIAEQKGIFNRMRLGAREMVMDDMGGREVRDGVVGAVSDIGMDVEYGIRNLSDKMYGIKERRLVGADALERVKGSNNFMTTKEDEFRNKARDVMGDSYGGGVLQDAMDDALGNTKTAAVGRFMKGAVKGGAAAGALTMGVGSGVGALAGGIEATMNPEHSIDVQKLRKIRKAIQQGGVGTEKELELMDEVKGPITSQERADLSSMIKDPKMRRQFNKQVPGGPPGGVQDGDWDEQSEDEIAIGMAKGLGLDESVISKAGGQDKFLNAMDSDEFKSIIQDAKKLMGMYNSGKGGQSKAYTKLSMELEARIRKLKSDNPEAADAAEAILRGMGIVPNANGKAGIDVSGMKIATGLEEGETHVELDGWTTGADRKTAAAKDSKKLQETFNKYDSARDVKTRKQALEAGFGTLGVGKLEHGGDEEEFQKSAIVGAGAMSDADIERFAGGDARQRIIADVAKKSKAGETVDAKLQQLFMHSIKNEGVVAMGKQGSVKADGLDQEALGAATTAAFGKVQEVSASQLQLLSDIVTRIKD